MFSMKQKKPKKFQKKESQKPNQPTRQESVLQKKTSRFPLPTFARYTSVAIVATFASSIVTLAGYWFLHPEADPYAFVEVNRTTPVQKQEEQSSIEERYVVLPPSKKPNTSPEPYLSAHAAIAIDRASGATLFARNEKEQLWPASTTKIMTALVSLEEFDQNEVVLVTNPVSAGSTMGLINGERITVRHLLYGLLIQSANDAAYALAAYHRSGVAEFVGRMNQKASEIGLENTHFVNPAGFDDDKQFTTASDLAKLSLVALDNPTVAEIVAIPLISVSDIDYTHFHELRNVNQLLGRVPGVAGVKTGFTENAKENLVNLTKRGGHEVLTVILGSEDRFGETQNLTDWVFNSYMWPGNE